MGFGKKIEIGTVQIGDRFGSDYYFPYSIGVLQAYAQQYLSNPDEFIFRLPIYKRVGVVSAIDYLISADIVFFSNYIWNHEINLKIADGLRRKKSHIIIVFGGPQIPESPDEAKKYLSNYSFLDIICYGEGEAPFLGILENVHEKTWEKVTSIGFINKNNQYTHNPQGERIKDIDKIPSPYLAGIFNALVEAYPDEKWAALLETNRGCPFSCSYCYWGKKPRSRVYQFAQERIYKEIDWFSEHKIEFVFCCDANFGIFGRDQEIAEKVAINKKQYGYPKVFSVQNTKNSTKKIFTLQKMLNDAGLQKGVNLALQSLNEKTLKSINRSNISNLAYKDLQRMFTENKIPTFSDMILGLPDETYDSFTSGTSNLIESGQHNRIQFINLAILENTEMAEPEYQKKYGFVVAETKIVPHHASLNEEDKHIEVQRLVVGTNTMPEEEWVKTRVFCWMISLLYFNKLLQVPFLLINSLYSIGFKELTEIFMLEYDKLGKLSEIVSFLKKKAAYLQKSGFEYVASKEWLNIWWPVDEYIFIKLCAEGDLIRFYKESELALSMYLKRKGLNMPPELLKESIEINKDLIKQPFIDKDITVTLGYNILELYQKKLSGGTISLQKGIFNYMIDKTSNTWPKFEDWLRDVVWYGTKKGAYLYEFKRL